MSIREDHGEATFSSHLIEGGVEYKIIWQRKEMKEVSSLEMNEEGVIGEKGFGSALCP